MPGNLNRRVVRLENKGGGKGRILTVVKYPEDSEDDDAIKRAGIEPTDDDIVLIVRRF